MSDDLSLVNDLLRRLRYSPPEEDETPSELLLEAADEIERLTRERDQWLETCKDADEEIIALTKEVERLTRERDDAEKLAESLQNKWASRPLDHPSGDALVAENDRLRALLAEALEASDDHPDGPMLHSATAEAIHEALRGAVETTATLGATVRGEASVNSVAEASRPPELPPFDDVEHEARALFNRMHNISLMDLWAEQPEKVRESYRATIIKRRTDKTEGGL